MAAAKCHRPTRTALTDHGGNQRDLDVEAGFDGASNCLGLTARLGVDPGIGAGGIDKSQHRQTETLGEPHQPLHFSITLGACHPEIVNEPFLGIRALFGADRHDAAPAETAEAADNRPVLGKSSVTRERDKLGNQPADIIEGVRPLRVARDLHFLPRRQPRICLTQQPRRRGFESADLIGDVEFAGGREVPQLIDLAFELADRPLEIEEMAHHFRRASGCPVCTSWRSLSDKTCV